MACLCSEGIKANAAARMGCGVENINCCCYQRLFQAPLLRYLVSIVGPSASSDVLAGVSEVSGDCAIIAAVCILTTLVSGELYTFFILFLWY